MRRIISLFFLFSILIQPIFSQELKEMEIEHIPESENVRLMVRNSNESILIVYSTIPDLNFESNRGIINTDHLDQGEYRLHIEPGTHIITFKADGYIKKKQRFYIPAKTHKEVKIKLLRPKWVERYLEGLAIEDADHYYYGIGKSKKSQQDADARARKEFGLSVKVKVTSVFEEEIWEKDRRFKEFASFSSKQISDICLRGITIAEKHQESKVDIIFKIPIKKTYYFSLIKVEKNKYENLVKEGIRQEIKIKEEEYKRDIALKKIKEEKQRQELIIEKSKYERKKREEELKKAKKESKLKQKIQTFKRKSKIFYETHKLYRNFLDDTPPVKVITSRTGAVIPHSHRLETKTGIAPITIESLFYAYHIWLLEFSNQINFCDNKIEDQQFNLKLQILPHTGKIWKTSVSFGYLEYLNSLDTLNKIDIQQLEPNFSPFLAMNFTIPSFHYTYLSLYGDARKISAGINNYTLYRHFKKKVCFLLQIDYIFDKKYRNRYNDSILFQGGIRFKPTSKIDFTLAFEDHEIFTFSVNYNFGSK